jgi:hypothetical protein
MRRQTDDGDRVPAQANEPIEAGGYRPCPADTSGVTIPPDVAGLTELLARNTHENWARQRLSDGWRWGPARDDAKREHPCLVAYEELPEAEKEYDRRTALETVRLILALGFRIVSPRGEAPPASAEGRRP